MQAIAVTERFAERVREFVPESRVYIFGSHAKGTQRPSSDIDIAVLVEHFPEKEECWEINHKMAYLCEEFEELVEPHYVSMDDVTGFVNTILATGIEVSILPGWE